MSFEDSKNQRLISQRELSRQVGRSLSWVQDQIKAGKIPYKPESKKIPEISALKAVWAMELQKKDFSGSDLFKDEEIQDIYFDVLDEIDERIQLAIAEGMYLFWKAASALEEKRLEEKTMEQARKMLLR